MVDKYVWPLLEFQNYESYWDIYHCYKWIKYMNKIPSTFCQQLTGNSFVILNLKDDWGYFNYTCAGHKLCTFKFLLDHKLTKNPLFQHLKCLV